MQLYKWDEATQRWIVSLQDGSVKSIRVQNLDPIDRSQRDAPGPNGREAAEIRSAQTAAPEPPRTTQSCPSESLDREELKMLAREMLASSGEQASDEVLNALSVEDLLELVNTLQIDTSDTSAPRESEEFDVSASAGYPPDERPAPRSATFSDVAKSPRASKLPEPAEPPNLESERERLELEEARLQSLAEAQSKRAEELQAREEALRQAVERLEKRRAEVDAAQAEQKEPVVRIPFVLPDDMSPATKAVEAEREELQRLREEVEAAAKEMEVRQQAAKHRAEERELQLLEEESAQIQMASTLKEEEARLDMQRRSLGMLQQALFKGATEAKPAGLMEHSLNDEDTHEESQNAEAATSAQSAGEATHPDDASEAGDEVWDLDWSAVCKDEGPPQAREAGKESGKETQEMR